MDETEGKVIRGVQEGRPDQKPRGVLVHPGNKEQEMS